MIILYMLHTRIVFNRILNMIKSEPIVSDKLIKILQMMNEHIYYTIDKLYLTEEYAI
jgi:hypothetical protein